MNFTISFLSLKILEETPSGKKATCLRELKNGLELIFFPFLGGQGDVACIPVGSVGFNETSICLKLFLFCGSEIFAFHYFQMVSFALEGFESKCIVASVGPGSNEQNIRELEIQDSTSYFFKKKKDHYLGRKGKEC